MEKSSYRFNKYETIINVICKYKGISKTQLGNILKDKECKYLLLLLLENYKCMDLKQIEEDFKISSKRSIRYNVKKAEEKFFINRSFREKYLELEEIAKQII
ncbi:MAG: ribose-5-phosphate isomerase [Clostridiales bacterium]|nr:ribose-5-phosphate isomerase [Clostridiales bacterium]